MTTQSKLKPNKAWLPGIIIIFIGILYLFASIAEDHLFGTHFTAWIYGAIIILGTMWFFIKLKHIPILIRGYIFLLGLITGTGAWHYQLAKYLDTMFSAATFQIHTLILGICIIFLIPFLLYYPKKMESFYRKLFELAAQPIDDTENGFTPRPYPAGKAQYIKDEILGFAKFMNTKMIAVSHVEEDKVILTFSTGFSHLAEPDLRKTSYITFDFSGNISVSISKKDYLQYKEELTFDQLCNSLAELFKKFLVLYQNGKSKQIIEQFKSDMPNSKKYIYLGFVILGIVTCLAGIVLYFIFVSNI